MRNLVIGVPARNEADTIVALVDALEAGAVMLGEATAVQLVLAYQDSADDTLTRFLDRRSRLSQRVLCCPPGTAGKGRNVKLLIDHAADRGADLLLVDGDMRDYEPADLARFVDAGHDGRSDLVLPLWCRPWGHANVTNYLAVPLLHALYGAFVRQPLAGQRFIANRWLRRFRSMTLPDDYGIDVALTMAVLDGGGRIDQVPMPPVDHDDRQLNSAAIMVEVARALLGRVATGGVPDRSDVQLPADYADHLTWPDSDGSRAPSAPDPASARRTWLEALTTAVRASRAGAVAAGLPDELEASFFAHADRRRGGARPAMRDAEAYVWDMGRQLATLLS